MPALPGCQRPWRSQLTPSHPPRNTRGIAPTGTKSRCCSTGSGGAVLDLLNLPPLPTVLSPASPVIQHPGMHQGASLKGLWAIPSRRPLCHHQWLRRNKTKTPLYARPPGAGTGPRWGECSEVSSPAALMLLLGAARKSCGCCLLSELRQGLSPSPLSSQGALGP